MRTKFSIRRPSAGAALGGLALVVATSGVAVAAIPGGNGTVTACVTSGGAVKVIDAEQGHSCPSGQTTITLASADAAGKVADADLLDGKDSTAFLGAAGKAADADLLDGKDSTAFLGAAGKAADADLLDGKDATDFLGADALPGKVSRHFENVEIPAGATESVDVVCPEPSAVAVGGGAHWGSGPGHHQLAENIIGILNASTVIGHFGWSAVATNDEASPLWLTVQVVCLNP